MEVALYPFEYMNITQRHDEGNHLKHWYPTPNPLYSDKPWDEACRDSGRSYFVAFNEWKIVEKRGTQSGGYSVRLETTKKLKIPALKDAVILEMTLTHLNYDDYSKLKVGQIIKKGQKLIREGTSGEATGNHFHCTINTGLYSGFYRNSNGKYVFAYKKSLLPDQAFYIDTTKTQIINAKKYKFIGVNYSKGMVSDEVANIDDFIATKVRGNYYGDYTVETIKVFQSKENLKVTGNVNLETFEKLLEKGAKL